MPVNKLDRLPSFDPKTIRRKILKMAYEGSTVHIACAFSIVEILACLYRDHVNYPDNNPNSKHRDFLILSKGHGVMAQYACIHELGWISDFDVESYFKDGSELKGLCDSRLNGLEVTSGTLGHGVSVGVGLAKAIKLKGSKQKVYVVVGDGELNEGAIWEAFMFAAHHKLNNLTVIIDLNGLQAMGATSDILQLGNLKDKLKTFDFVVSEVDGHSIDQLDRKLSDNNNLEIPAPRAIIAKTIKGKGVSFMENENRWHYTRLNSVDYQKALKELD